MNKYLAGGLAWLEIPPPTNDCVLNEKRRRKRGREVGRARFEPPGPAMSRLVKPYEEKILLDHNVGEGDKPKTLATKKVPKHRSYP